MNFENDEVLINILEDKSRLQEIYELRVTCWENSPHSHIINSKKFPNGLKDELDDESIHIVASNKDNAIMGACRVTLFDSQVKYPYKIFLGTDVLIPPFSLIGRGIHKKDFGIKRLQYSLCRFGVEISKSYGMKYVTGHAYEGNTYMQKLMQDLGWDYFCDIAPEQYKHPSLAYPGKLYIGKL